MKVILVPVADRPECVTALHTAFQLARQLDANVTGCHIRAHSGSDVVLPAELGADATLHEAAWNKAWEAKATGNSSALAEKLFAKLSARHKYRVIKKPKSKPGAVWMEKVGSPDRVLAIMGPVSDLIVVSRPAATGGRLGRMFMQAALLKSSRPVLILPQKKAAIVGKHIAIAWNQSAEAALAVAAAMPLLQLAEQVSIITCSPEREVGPTSRQLATYLRFWGIEAERVTARVRGLDDSKALLKGYRETRSDILVMGAYSRDRLRQRIFGGVTQFMLQKANIPVFMLHT